MTDVFVHTRNEYNRAYTANYSTPGHPPPTATFSTRVTWRRRTRWFIRSAALLALNLTGVINSAHNRLLVTQRGKSRAFLRRRWSVRALFISHHLVGTCQRFFFYLAVSRTQSRSCGLSERAATDRGRVMTVGLGEEEWWFSKRYARRQKPHMEINTPTSARVFIIENGSKCRFWSQNFLSFRRDQRFHDPCPPQIVPTKFRSVFPDGSRLRLIANHRFWQLAKFPQLRHRGIPSF